MPTPTLNPRGPANASIVIVTEFATADDLWKGAPLSGHSGSFFASMLHEAGIVLAECYVTPVLKHRPAGDTCDFLYSTKKSEAQKYGLTSSRDGAWVSPSVIPHIEAVLEEVRQINPKVVIALGDFAMFALAGVYGSVDTWRGSLLDAKFECPNKPWVIPTYSPSFVQRMYQTRGFCVRDLQRAQNCAAHPELYVYPTYDFRIRPTFELARSTLLELLAVPLSGKELMLACDIETIARHISCIGIAWSCRESLCIPFLTIDGHYWTEEEEIELSFLLKELLTHPLVEVVGQNFNYDNQHFAKHLGYLPHQGFDTMIAQHVLFPGIPKALDFLSSMYCHWHRYWKDEMDDYSRLPENMEQYWTYNCKDTVVTYEAALVLKELLSHLHRWPQYEFMQDVARSALVTMLRGVRINQTARSAVAGQLMAAIAEYDSLIHDIVGFPLNVGSPAQMQKFFYDDLQLPRQINRKTKRPSCDAKALATLSQKEPLIRPLVELIEKRRSLGVFLSTFCLMRLSPDGRMRCSFNVCGTETMRFSSSEDAFGNGGNLQNVPKGEEDE